MKNLVENLLLKYKSEKNQIVLQIEPYPLEDIIRKCLEEIHYLTQDKGQKSLFQEDFNNQIIDSSIIEAKVIDHFSEYHCWTSLTEAEACFFVEQGVICKSGEIAKILRKLEMDGGLAVRRNPDVSEKTRKPSTFMSEGHGKTVSIKWVKQ